MRLSAADDREGCAGRSLGRLECLTSRDRRSGRGTGSASPRDGEPNLPLSAPRDPHHHEFIHAGVVRHDWDVPSRGAPVATLGDGGVSGCGRHEGGLSRSATRPPSPAGVGPHDRGSPGPPEGPPKQPYSNPGPPRPSRVGLLRYDHQCRPFDVEGPAVGLLAGSSGFGPAWRVDGGKIVSLTA